MRPACPEDLEHFLANPRDSREYRRGLAVKMALQMYEYPDICAILGVTPGFISAQKKIYLTHGIVGLQLKYQGNQPLLDAHQRAEVISWIKQQETWSVPQLRDHLEETYDVTYQSLQSYYTLFDDAGISYKRSQPANPQEDAQAVAQKKKR